MIAESAKTRMPKKRLLVVLGLCGLVVVGYSGWVWVGVQKSRSLANEEAKVVMPLLVRAVAAVDEQSDDLRVALFLLDERNMEPTEPLERILNADPKCTWAYVSPDDVCVGTLEEYDTVIFPGGSAGRMARSLGEGGGEAVREFVGQGGGYVGICGGAFLATAKFESGLALVNAKPLTDMIEIPGQGMQSMAARGAGSVEMELTDLGEQVFGDHPGLLSVKFTGGPILRPAGDRSLPPYIPLAMYRTELWLYEPQRNTMIDTPAAVAARYGRGRVILFSPHPEMTQELEPLLTIAIRATSRGRSSAESEETDVGAHRAEVEREREPAAGGK